MRPKDRASQVAALPLTVGNDDQIYVLLVTSRETKRWVIPKGWPSRKMTDSKAASREADEEAGVTGTIESTPIGSYRYRKVLPENTRIISVDVYPLWVRKQRKNWQEKGERVRVWATLDEAAKLVREPGLKRLFAGLSAGNLMKRR